MECVCLIDIVKSNDREGRTALTFEEASENGLFLLNFCVFGTYKLGQ